MQMRRLILEGMGWLGALFGLLAFGLNSFNVITSQSVWYLGMYSIGCILMGLYGYSKKAPASWVLNLIFFLVALLALARAFLF